jgi:exodeoxyribonuclease-3
MTQLKLISWNVNGIRACEKRGFLNWLQSTNADIVMLQETKATPEQVSDALRNPPGYTSAWSIPEKKGYSGVATYSREPGSVIRGFGEERFDREGRVLISTFPQLTVFNIYFPSGNSGPERVAYKLDFYQRFLTVVREYIARGERVVVAGDVNTAYAEIDLARPRENRKTSGFLPEERAAIGQFFEAGLVDTFRYLHPDKVKYSWWAQRSDSRARNVGWRLDYIFVSENLRDSIVAADTHPEIEGSDHCPVSAILEL